MLLSAAYILPIGMPAVPAGKIRVQGSTMTELGTQLNPLPGETVIELPQHVLLPGLINAHTHLDLSNTAGPLPQPTTYRDWVEAIIAVRQQFSADDLRSGMALATAQLLRSGVTTIGDYVGDLRIMPLLSASPFSGRAFVEIIAAGPARVEERQAAFEAMLRGRGDSAWPCSLTPHALHTVDRMSLQMLLKRHATHRAAPLAIHCAESREEVELFTAQRGPLYDFMTAHGYHYGPLVDSPLHFLRRHGGVPAQSCLIHCNDLTDDDIAAIAAAHCTVIHCPQSHAYFGHAPFPMERLLAVGVPIALGTDGLPCAVSLNFLTELRLIRERWPSLSAEAILQMATRNGAAALWLSDRGQLAPGLRADLIAVPCRHTRDPYEAVVTSRDAPFVMIGGQVVRNAL